jgi:VWFA-related protein
MYNAVYIALQELAALPQPSTDEVRRDVIIVLSDGEDTTSLVTFDSVLDSAKRSKSVIYTIGLGSTGGVMRSREADPEFALRALAQETGGRLFLTRTGAALPDIYTQIADELASQYVVGYVSSNTQPSGYRRITVRVARPGVQARTRAGYYAGKSQLAR